jgi:hypothetical protein
MIQMKILLSMIYIYIYMYMYIYIFASIYIYICICICIYIYLGALRVHDPDEDTSFYDEAVAKGFGAFPYCLVYIYTCTCICIYIYILSSMMRRWRNDLEPVHIVW